MRRMTAVLAGAVGLIGVLDAGATAEPRITQADSGKTFRLVRGTGATLRLTDRWQWSEPRASTKAVDLEPVEYFIDPGFREWRVEAQAPGTATIRAYGKRACNGCSVRTRRFRVTIVVRNR